ncbi:phage tail assembly protein [Pseudomonas putida]|uniref:phage tail assembly protein n=1 Tax=Pseudomonas putida TaxID=303 RepID=UPI002DBD61EC|nr:phage tail assembly protein [Pseudomonas putida]WRW04677.1 phage tail assembly protein [Pseudomonas putida]
MGKPVTAQTLEDVLAELDDDERSRIEDLGDAIQVALLEPLTFQQSKLDGQRTVEELRLPKKVKGKHLKKLDSVKGEVTQSLALMAALAGVPAHALDELDARDLELMTTVMGPFLPKSRKTGLD